MNNFDQIKLDQQQAHRKTIQASRILAQAKARRADGKIKVIVVYEMSDYNFYFFQYTAQGWRSPRKTWKLSGWSIVHEARRYDPQGLDKSLDLRLYLVRQEFNLQDKTWNIRYPHKKKIFSQHIERIGNPDLSNPYAPAGSTFVTAQWHATGKKPNKYEVAKLSTPKVIYHDHH